MAINKDRLSPELSAWLKARQNALKIVKTTTTPSGQTIDWVPIESQVSHGRIATPPPAATTKRSAHPKRPVEPAGFELDDPRVEHGPPGAVPILRPNISRFQRTRTLDEYLTMTKKGGLLVNKRARLRSTPNDPNPAGYFHCTDGQSGTFYGWDGHFNVWAPTINSPLGNGADHSILQVWLQNNKPPLQSLEGGWTVDQSLNGDTQPHIFTYYTTNGYAKDGDNIGGYNTLHKGFVQYSSASTTGSVVFPGIRLSGLSTWGGGQTDVSMKFQLYQEPGTNTFNWWVAVQGIWMGYYPATLFNGGLGASVTWVGSGGEVNSTLSNPELTEDQMGSGWQAAAGWTEAAFLRNLRTQSDLSGTMAENDGTGSTDAASPGGADPYTIQTDMESGTTWGSYFYCGGPNPAAVADDQFNQITFDIVTGGDDLRGDSSATATVALPGGAQTFTLKAQSDGGWSNNSEHVRTFNIAGPALLLDAFGVITITLTSHNGLFETDDNWNIQSANITVNGPSGSAVLFDQGGNPLARLTGSAPSVTLQPEAGA